MDWEILIPILMFLFPIAISLIDKRVKKRKGIPQVQTRPVAGAPRWEVPGQVREQAPATGPDPGQTVFPTAAVPEPPRQAGEPDEEGTRAIRRESKIRTETVEEKKKLDIDKKKLILYSEILKPKFDA